MALYTREFYQRADTGFVDSSDVLIPLILELCEPSSVLDVGCGTATWLEKCVASGVEDVFGMDGDYVELDQLKIPAALFRAHDLGQPFDLGRRFDLAMSLEVAEHLPPESAASFVECLVHHADVVVFSAAIPFQGGRGHVNEQWPSYWAELFERHGYDAIDCLRSRIWNEERVQWWYAQNTVIYANPAGLADRPMLAAEHRTSKLPLPLVHPRKYVRVADPSRGSFSAALNSLPRLALRSVRKRLGLKR